MGPVGENRRDLLKNRRGLLERECKKFYGREKGAGRENGERRALGEQSMLGEKRVNGERERVAGFIAPFGFPR